MSEIRISGNEQIADWIETTIISDGTGSAGNISIEGRARDAISVEAAAVGLAFTTMKRRSQLLGAQYPFEVTPVGILCSPSARSNPYTALLLMTPEGLARQSVNPTPTQSMAELFERIACRAMVGLLGPESVALRFGWPSDIGRPVNFPAAIKWLAEKMRISPGNAYRPPRRKDGGVDVVAWRPFPDGRSGFPVVLVQCTLGREILTKASDIDVRNWAGWLTLDADPATALAVPGTVPADESWNELAAKCLVLDRIRLIGLLEGTSEEPIAGLESEVADLLLRLANVS